MKRRSQIPSERRSQTRSSSGAELIRRPLIALLALAPAIPIVAGLIIAGQGYGSTSSAALFSPVPSVRLKAIAQASGVPSGRGALVAVVTRSSTLRAQPHGRPLAPLSLTTQFGSRQSLWVVSRSGGWLGVLSPQLGNGRIGWIPLSAVSLFRDPWEVRVSLSARRVSVLDAGQVVARYTVAIGRPEAPTPTGRFDVTDRLLTGDPTGPYGCCVVALSAVSPHAIQDWSGGDRIAIHSTTETDTIGEPVSHGCLRLTSEEARWLLGHLPLGTPVVIRA